MHCSRITTTQNLANPKQRTPLRPASQREQPRRVKNPAAARSSPSPCDFAVSSAQTFPRRHSRSLATKWACFTHFAGLSFRGAAGGLRRQQACAICVRNALRFYFIYFARVCSVFTVHVHVRRTLAKSPPSSLLSSSFSRSFVVVIIGKRRRELDLRFLFSCIFCMLAECSMIIVSYVMVFIDYI